MSIDVRPASSRFRTEADGRRTRHSFSFGSHYDPGNVGFAAMVAHNDETLDPGTGYAEHPHRDLEIVTFMVSGALQHSSAVGAGVIGPGQVQRLSAGTGVVHAEIADGDGPARFIQTWLRPTEPGGTPAYAAGRYAARPGLVSLVGDEGVLGVGADAALSLGTLRAGEDLALPDSAWLHLFVVSGSVALGGHPLGHRLGPGDAARMLGPGAPLLRAREPAQVLLWSG